MIFEYATTDIYYISFYISCDLLFIILVTHIFAACIFRKKKHEKALVYVIWQTNRTIMFMNSHFTCECLIGKIVKLYLGTCHVTMCCRETEGTLLALKFYCRCQHFCNSTWHKIIVPDVSVTSDSFLQCHPKNQDGL